MFCLLGPGVITCDRRGRRLSWSFGWREGGSLCCDCFLELERSVRNHRLSSSREAEGRRRTSDSKTTRLIFPFDRLALARSAGVMATPTAPTYSVGPPTTHFAAIEYPGPVNSTPRALKTLGGLPHISSVLANPPSPARVIELSLNAKNPFFHPVQANVLETGNIVLKVVRRRRKKPKRGEDGELEVGVFSIEVAGVATRTVRLRGALSCCKGWRTKLITCARCCCCVLSFRHGRLSDFYAPGRPYRRHRESRARDGRCVSDLAELATEALADSPSPPSLGHRILPLPRAQRRLQRRPLPSSSRLQSPRHSPALRVRPFFPRSSLADPTTATAPSPPPRHSFWSGKREKKCSAS